MFTLATIIIKSKIYMSFLMVQFEWTWILNSRNRKCPIITIWSNKKHHLPQKPEFYRNIDSNLTYTNEQIINNSLRYFYLILFLEPFHSSQLFLYCIRIGIHWQYFVLEAPLHVTSKTASATDKSLFNAGNSWQNDKYNTVIP